MSVHHYGRGAGETFAEWAYEIPVSPLTLCMVPQSDASSSRFLMSLSLATAALRNIPGTPGYGETSCRLTPPQLLPDSPDPTGRSPLFYGLSSLVHRASWTASRAKASLLHSDKHKT